MTTPTKGAQLDISISKHDLLLWLEANGACGDALKWVRAARGNTFGEFWSSCHRRAWKTWLVVDSLGFLPGFYCGNAYCTTCEKAWKAAGVTVDQVARAMVGELP